MRTQHKWFIATWLVLVAIFMVFPNPTYAQNDTIRVKIDYIPQVFGEVNPILVNGRTMVPMRHIFETLGCKVEWNNATQSVTSSTNDKIIKMTIGVNRMTVNGKVVELDAAPMIYKSKTMVPIRAVSEALGAEVEWVGKTKTVMIYYSMPRPISAKEANPMQAQNKQFERLIKFNPRRMAFNNDMNHFFVGTIVGDELILDGIYLYDEYDMFNFGVRTEDESGEYVYFKDADGGEIHTWVKVDEKSGQVPTHRIKLTEKKKPLHLAIYSYTKENHPTHPNKVIPFISSRVTIEWNEKKGEYAFRKPLKLDKLQQFYQKIMLGELQNPAQHLDKSRVTPSIQALSDSITEGAKYDYDKLRLIDQWMRDNIYYDHDSLKRPEEVYNYVIPDEVVLYKRATCWGHCITFTDLARAQNIPTTKVIGYISHDTDDGVFKEPGLHSWNIAFADGRWIIIDSTWNNASETKNGEWTYEPGSSTYFDASPVYMSASHDFRYIMESHDWEKDGWQNYEDY